MEVGIAQQQPQGRVLGLSSMGNDSSDTASGPETGTQLWGVEKH